MKDSKSSRGVSSRSKGKKTVGPPQGTLRNTGETLEALINCSPLAIISLDLAGNVNVWNPAAERIFGWKEQEVLGRPNPIVPPEKQEEFQGILKRILQGEACFNAEVARRRKDGSSIEISISASPVFGSEGGIVGVMGVISDITGDKKSRKILRESEERYRLLFENNPLPMWVYDLETLSFLDVNEAAVDHYGYSRDEFLAMTIKDIRLPEDRDALMDAVSKISGKLRKPGIWKHEKKNGEIIDVEIVTHDIEFRGKRARLVLAMDVTEHKQADERLRQHLKRATALYEGSQRLTESLDVQELAESVTRTCVDKFSVTLAWIGKAESDGRVSYIAHFPQESTYPLRITVRWDDTPPGRGPVGRAIRSGQPVTVAEISKDPESAPWHDIAREENILSSAAFPLISRGRTYGVLKLYSDKACYFTREYTQFFQTYAHQVASVLENARLFEETERHLEHLRALRAIDMAITSSLDLRVTLDVLLDNVTSQLKVDAGAVLLLNPRSKILEYASGRGFHTRALQHTRLQIGKGHAGKAVIERRIVKVQNITEAEGFDRVPMLKAEGFVSYFGVPLMAKGQVKGVLEIFHRKPLNPDEEWFEFLDALAGQAAIAIDNAALFNDLERSNVELMMAYETTLDGWSRALDLRDKETEGHTQRVAEMTLRLAQTMGMTDDELVHVRRGALLHDIGKMGVPDSILLKPGKLTDEEWGIMHKHPVYAYELLYPIAYLRNAIDIPYCHHEKWDGSGYPRGFKGKQIPLAARIFALIDVWDALRSDRPYRPAWPEEKTRDHIRELSGTHFDPAVVDLFLKIQW